MKEPIYIKVAKTIEKDIEKGIYKIKEKLPSERELAKIFEVSRMTARQAVTHLEEKGIVYREIGSGTFVQAPTIEQENVKSFTETVSALGYEVDTKILEFSSVDGIKMVSDELGLPYGTAYYKLKRLRLGNKIPMALEVLYVPKSYLPGLKEYALDGSFYTVLKEEYGLTVSKVAYKMEAVIANPVFSQIMELKKTTALLKVSGVCFDESGRKLFYEESLYRSDLYNYHIEFSKKY